MFPASGKESMQAVIFRESELCYEDGIQDILYIKDKSAYYIDLQNFYRE